jgi:hypothetical protein
MGRVSDGTELANTCVVEQIGVEWNSYPAEWGWTPLLNYATLEVCSLNNPFSHPHPDNARLTRTVSTCRGVLGCYTEGGAALNDINGTERDWVGDYFTGTSACHSIQVGGYEVPAAKRPATRTFPAPSVNLNSFIVWRPVNPNVTIANGSR